MSVASMERKTLIDLHVKALDESQRIRTKYEGRLTDMSAEESAVWTKWLDEADATRDKIDLLDREEKARAWGAEPQMSLTLAGKAGANPTDLTTEATQKASQLKAESAAWKSFFRGVTVGQMTPDSLKALAAQEGDIGGFLVVPQQYVDRLIAIVKDLLFMKELATVYPLVKAESLGVPVLDTEVNDPIWTSELGTGDEDAVKPFSKRQLFPHPVAKRIKISNKLLRQAAIDPETIILDRLAYKLARVEENAFLNGTGQDQPLGVFTPSASGISTARDVVCASTTVVVADELITMKHTLKVQYWPKVQWIMHRLVLGAIRKLKDSNQQYLWQPGVGGYVAQGTALVGANPDTILGFPYRLSELAPSTFTAAKYLAVLGDFSFYWIAEALDLQVQRLVELYAESNQTAFVLRAEVDGMPVLEEAFLRLQLHA